MNVIFLDFDGVLNCVHDKSDEELEKRIKILGDIVKEYNCKIVIEASMKSLIDEDTLEFDNEWLEQIFSLFEKYGIECVGRTPNVIRRLSSCSYLPMWKEDEIRLYLFRHPEIEHFCIIDDDDAIISDLDKLRNYLIKTFYYSENPDKEGLLEYHKEEVGKVLKRDNKYRKFALKHIENNKKE